MWVILTVVGLPFHIPVLYILVAYITFSEFKIRFPNGVKRKNN